VYFLFEIRKAWIKVQIKHFHQTLFLPTLLSSGLEAKIGMSKIGSFSNFKDFVSFLMLNLKTVGFIFLAITIQP
jgi:hypothetical protein